MKRVAPVLIGLVALAGAKKKAMGHGSSHSREERRQRFEEKAREWHRREHEALAEA